jgi:hypothetical protein
MKIDKNRTYTTRDGKAVRIYCTDGGRGTPIHGATKDPNVDGWTARTWTDSGLYYLGILGDGNDLIEALKPNGIPVDLPDPPEVEGYTWEVRGWGWKALPPVKGGSFAPNANQPKWFSSVDDASSWKACGSSEHFYIEYIPIPTEEMTLAEVCKALGKTVKIVK